MRGRMLALVAGRSHGQTGGGDERAVSPVVGVALLLAVTVILGLTVGPFVLGSAGNLVTDTPDADFAFFYNEDMAFEPTDDFGTSITEGDGMMVIKMERGDTIDPANVEVRAATSGGNLLEDSEVYGPDDRLRQGDTINVVINRGESVQVIWRAPGGDTSVILGELTVPGPSSTVPPGVPTPNLDCGWVDNVTDANGGDFDVEQGNEFAAGDVVGCDVFVDNNGVTVDGDLTVVGSIDAGAVTLGPGGNADAGDVYGSIESDSRIDLNDLTVTGGLTAGDEIDLHGVTVEDDIEAGDFTQIDDSTVDGEVVVNDTLEIQDTTITGHVDAESIDCDGNATIAGEDCMDYKKPKFDASITATTYPGLENETFRVEAVVENVRIESGTRNVSLTVDGTQHDSKSLTLAGGETALVPLAWANVSDPGEQLDVVVGTNRPGRDNNDTRTVAVESNPGSLPTVDMFQTSAGGGSITVDWSVTAGAANLSVVSVEVIDAQGEEVGTERMFFDEQTAGGNETFTVASETHSVRLVIDDHDGQSVRRLRVVAASDF